MCACSNFCVSIHQTVQAHLDSHTLPLPVAQVHIAKSTPPNETDELERSLSLQGTTVCGRTKLDASIHAMLTDIRTFAEEHFPETALDNIPLVTHHQGSASTSACVIALHVH